MFRKITLLLVLLSISTAFFAQQGTLKGEVSDGEADEGVPFATVKLIQNGTVKGGATTDFDGKFTISSITPGTYDVEVNAVGYTPKRVSGVIISADKIRFLTGSGAIVLDTGNELEEVEVITYQVPLIDKDGGASGGTITRDDIAKLPGRSAASIATTVGGVGTDANGNISSVRGARSGATFYYIDGIKVRANGNTGLPKSAIQEVSVMTGGIPANYGDATGGIISVTTRGPSSFYFGGVDFLTSGVKIGDNTYGLDKYAYNLLEGSISGPLVSRTDSSGNKEPLLGFFFSGNLTSIADSRPFAVDQYRLTEDARTRLLTDSLGGFVSNLGTEGNPVVIYNTDFLRRDDFETLKFRRNVGRRGATGQGKIDVNLGPTMNLTFGGTAVYNSQRSHNWAGSVFNSDNYPLQTGLTLRAFTRFTQRFENAKDEEGNDRKGGVKNVFYTVMADYSKATGTTQDDTFKDDIFRYGHHGKFERAYYKAYAYDGDRNLWDFQSYGQFMRFVADSNTLNVVPGLISQQVYDIVSASPVELYYRNNGPTTLNQYTLNEISQLDGDWMLETDYLTGRGLLNGSSPSSVYSIWSNMGAQYNGYSKFDNTQFRLTGSGSASIGNHSLTVGFEFEQRDERGFSVSPIGLWNLMRLLTNSHIEDKDESTEFVTTDGTIGRVDYDKLISVDDQSTFDYNLREALGLEVSGGDFLNVDEYDPSTFSLDMFSADELLNSGSNYVSYYGYDHTGKKVKNNSSFRDFYEQTENGDFTRPINSFQPVYMSGYIMDKFAFDDLIFNVGVRVDRFDANQPVLKDKFLFVPANTKADLEGASWLSSNYEIPDNISDEATVYVDDSFSPSKVNGYREGSVFYDENGVVVSDPETIYSGPRIAPWIDESSVDQDHSGVHVDALEDYTPQIVVMPRLSFSFPISDEALFFAHYDVLSQRPNGLRYNPLSYLYIDNTSINTTINNPALKPQRTIDYELGFQQVLSKSSSLKISSFYKEQRDMIAVVNIIGAYPGSYRTFENLDFGTSKGLTVTYDLRRSGNFRMTASYTLQFADGTGSSATSGVDFLNAGVPNFRTVSPTSFDQRHAFAGSFDYRYGEGKDYNGPVIKGKQIFKNTGANMAFNFGSGLPYSAQSNITPAAGTGGAAQFTGTINGSRKPWQYRFDTQIDRNVSIKRGGEGDDAKTPLNLNIYLQVNNVFNIVNVVNVYAATGNPDDDGYLNTAVGQNFVSSTVSPLSFVDYYNMKMTNPYFYSIPRTIRLGVKLDF